MCVWGCNGERYHISSLSEGTDGTGWNLGYILVDTTKYCDEFYEGYEYDPVPFQVADEPKTTEGGCINIDIFMETFTYGDEVKFVNVAILL